MAHLQAKQRAKLAAKRSSPAAGGVYSRDALQVCECRRLLGLQPGQQTRAFRLWPAAINQGVGSGEAENKWVGSPSLAGIVPAVYRGLQRQKGARHVAWP